MNLVAGGGPGPTGAPPAPNLYYKQDVVLGDFADYKQKYSSIKVQLKAILYENELLQDELHRLQSELLDIYRDKETLLEKIIQNGDFDSSSSSESESQTSDIGAATKIKLLNKNTTTTTTTTNTSNTSNTTNNKIAVVGAPPPSSTPSIPQVTTTNVIVNPKPAELVSTAALGSTKFVTLNPITVGQQPTGPILAATSPATVVNTAVTLVAPTVIPNSSPLSIVTKPVIVGPIPNTLAPFNSNNNNKHPPPPPPPTPTNTAPLLVPTKTLVKPTMIADTNVTTVTTYPPKPASVSNKRRDTNNGNSATHSTDGPPKPKAPRRNRKTSTKNASIKQTSGDHSGSHPNFEQLSAEELEQHLEARRIEQTAQILADWELNLSSEILNADSSIKFMAED